MQKGRNLFRVVNTVSQAVIAQQSKIRQFKRLVRELSIAGTTPGCSLKRPSVFPLLATFSPIEEDRYRYAEVPVCSSNQMTTADDLKCVFFYSDFIYCMPLLGDIATFMKHYEGSKHTVGTL